MKIDELEQIIKILKQNEVNEFEFDNDGVRIRLSRGALVASSGARQVVVHDIEPAVVGALNGKSSIEHHSAVKEAPKEDTSHLIKVESPIVGTFYRRPSPDIEPFVTEGTTVKKGQTLCIIEAMKLMNEIEAPCSGKIEKILLSDSQVVEFGEVLFLINPNS